MHTISSLTVETIYFSYELEDLTFGVTVLTLEDVVYFYVKFDLLTTVMRFCSSYYSFNNR